ncbi:MAG: cytochrome ubiquinol oxidase subunit I [Myxococcales bacterium]|nr:cytochrome ubiquinol oxidase subunit I [Myxococcales bacterium]
MRGMVIGAVGIVHVFLAQFAIGGGMLLTYLQWRAGRGDELARTFIRSFFKYLVLVSFVAGALTGVAMWFTTIQVGARTIGLMIDEFHWLWATEWVFFFVEVVAGYTFLRVGDRLSDPLRLRLLGLYTFAAVGSLFWINGILAWQLTPGAWVRTHDLWAGFWNPSFWPSLGYRLAVSATLAALAGVLVVGTLDVTRAQRHHLVTAIARLMLPMVAMPVFGVWFLAVIPADSRRWLTGGSVAMSMFLAMAAGATALIGAYAVGGLVWKHLYASSATAALLLALAFVATAAGEFVREGARKPYTVRGVLYSNSIAPDEVARLRRVGSVVDDPYPLRDAARFPNPQLALGAKVYRAQCSACHTLHGANALVDLVTNWSLDQRRLNIAQLQRTKGFMPPFAGTAVELEALVQLLGWEEDGGESQEAAWPEVHDPAALARIAAWLDEAGPAAAPVTR